MKKLRIGLLALLMALVITGSSFAGGITIQSRGAKKGVNDDITQLTGLTTPITVAQGGQGSATLADGGLLIGAAAGPVEVVAAGATTEILVGGGAGTNPVWATATGAGAPVRAENPVLVGPALGTPTSGTLTNCTGLPTSGLASQVFAAGIGIGGKAAETGGVSFPATAVVSADANTLDDYEEGEFDGNLSPDTGTITVNTAKNRFAYTKTGRVVHIQGAIEVTSVNTPAGQLAFTGLPYNSAVLTEDADNVYVPIGAQVLSGAVVGVVGILLPNSTTVYIQEFTGTDNVVMSDHIQAGTIIRINFSYIGE